MILRTAHLSDAQAKKYAELLLTARASKVPIEPFTDAHPDLGMEDGYAIQKYLVRELVNRGETIAGYKIGLTSVPMQKLLGVDSPDFGPVFASTVYGDGAVLTSDAFIAPRIEGEIAVVLERELSGPGCTSVEVRRSASGLVAALEIVDSRFKDWRIKLADTVADLASSGAIAVSSKMVSIDNFDPKLIGMVFSKNDEVLATAAGAAALGDPLAAVAWLANTLAPLGESLPAGSIIMTGALHAMVPVASGDVFRAEFDRLGPITIRMAAD